MYKFEELKPLGILAIILFIIAIIGIIFTPTSAKGLFSLMWAVFFYLILPGYFIMLNFDFDVFERVILGMVSSAAIIPAILYGINFIGIKISALNIHLVIIFIILCAILYRKFILKNKIKKEE